MSAPGRLQITCILTRMELRRVWFAPIVWWRYHKLKQLMKGNEGLLAHALLWESPRTCVTLSVWRSPIAIVAAATTDHVLAVRFAYRSCRELWSTQWHLTRLSSGADHWGALDWESLAEACGLGHDYGAAFTVCTGRAAELKLDKADEGVRLGGRHE